MVSCSFTIPIVPFHTKSQWSGDGLTWHPVNVFTIQQFKKGIRAFLRKTHKLQWWKIWFLLTVFIYTDLLFSFLFFFSLLLCFMVPVWCTDGNSCRALTMWQMSRTLFIIFKIILIVLNEPSRWGKKLFCLSVHHILTLLTLSRTILQAALLPSISWLLTHVPLNLFHV